MLRGSPIPTFPKREGEKMEIVVFESFLF